MRGYVGRGFFSTFRSWNLVSTRFRGPVYGSVNGKVRHPRRYPRNSGYVIAVNVPGGKSGWKQSPGSPECLPSQKSISLTPVNKHIETTVHNPSGPANRSGGDNNGGAVRNGSGGPPTQRTPRIQQPVDTWGSLGGRCPHSDPPGQQGPYLQSGSANPQGLVSGPALKVGGVPQLEALYDCHKLSRSSPHLTRVST